MKPRNFFYSLVATSLMASFADAAVLRYRQSGNWTDIYTGAGNGWANNNGTVSGSIPGAGDEARINFGNNTVIVNSDVGTTSQVKIGVDEGGTLRIANGGILRTTSLLRAGNNDGGAISDTTGNLIVESGGQLEIGGIFWTALDNSSGFVDIQAGGVVTAGDHLWWGVDLSAEINIAGTLTQTNGILGLGTSNASTASGGTAEVNILDGGVLNLFNISGNPGTPSIQAGSVINMDPGSTLTVDGNKLGSLQNYIDANEIVANGGDFDLSFDGSRTTLTVSASVIPEPSVFGLALVGAAIGILRRRR